MKRLVTILLLFAAPVIAQRNPVTGRDHSLPPYQVVYRTNDPTVGTLQYHFVCATATDPPLAKTCPAGAPNSPGVCIFGCGTTGDATIAVFGDAPVAYDVNPSAVGEFVVLSATQGGKGHGLGAGVPFPTRGTVKGGVLSLTPISPGVYLTTLFPIGVRGHVETPAVPTGVNLLRDDGQFVAPPAGGSVPTGTGFRRIVGGVENAAASEPDWAQITSKPATFAPSAHSHVKADVSDFAHTHPQGEVTNLVSDLAGKAATVHTHVGADILSGAVPLATSLAVNPANCPVGQAPLGVDASGAVEGCFIPGGGSAIAFREFALCSGTCVTFTNQGAGPTEMGSQASRSHIDLSGFTDARVIANLSAAAVTSDYQFECAPTTGFAAITDLLQWDNPTNNTLIEGTWTAIPVGCKTAGGVYVRVVAISGNGTEDPAYRFIKLQVR